MQSSLRVAMPGRASDEHDIDLAVNVLEPINAPGVWIEVAVAALGLNIGALIAYVTR